MNIPALRKLDVMLLVRICFWFCDVFSDGVVFSHYMMSNAFGYICVVIMERQRTGYPG